MPMDEDALWPIPREALLISVNYAKKMPTLNEARQIIGLLENLFRGINNQEAFGLIDSITLHFKNEVEQKMLEQAEAYMDKKLRTHFNFPELDLTDEQIADAIMQMVKNSIIQSKRDWVGIFRILVDKCHWSDVFKDFERRIQRMKGMKLLKNIPPNIDFDYQGLQQGLDMNWPETYQEWLAKTDGDSTFIHRRDVATTFYNYLKAQLDKPSNY